MELMSAIPNSFVIGEPYREFEVTRDRGDNHFANRVPTISSLLNCSVIDNAELAKAVFWRYTCYFYPAIKSDKKRFDDCNAGLIDMEWMRHMCTSASVKVAKIIRVRFLARLVSA